MPLKDLMNLWSDTGQIQTSSSYLGPGLLYIVVRAHGAHTRNGIVILVMLVSLMAPFPDLLLSCLNK